MIHGVILALITPAYLAYSLEKAPEYTMSTLPTTYLALPKLPNGAIFRLFAKSTKKMFWKS